MSLSPIRLSDHAFRRYFERVEGRSIEMIERFLLSGEVIERINTLGDCSIPIEIDGANFLLVVRNRIITTIAPDKGYKKKQRYKQGRHDT